MIMNNVIDEIENKSDTKKWEFDLDVIKKNFTNVNVNIENNNDNLNDSYAKIIQNKSIEKKEEIDLFYSKYLIILNESELLEKKENENIREFLLYQKENLSKKNNTYNFNNEIFLQKLNSNTNISNNILNIYQHNFFQVINKINMILNNLLNNINLVPYSIKCLCKIIKTLLLKKFPNLNKFKINLYLSSFFFKKLFLPIFKKPDYNGLISDIIINENTFTKINILENIIIQFISGNFFNNIEHSNFTPFNWFFIEAIEKLNKFFDLITSMNTILPNYIENILINDNYDDFYYDYFEQNKNECILHKSICFCLEDFKTIYNIIEKNENIIFKNKEINKNFNIFYLTYNKLKQDVYVKLIDKLYKNDKKTNIKKFILITKIEFNEEFNNLIKIDYKNDCFTFSEIKENSEIDKNTLKEKNTIIKIKNFLCKLLYNYRDLIITDFNENSTNSTIEIIKELLKILKINIYVLDNKVPSVWYAQTLLTLLKILPEEFSKDDYFEIYDSITNEIEKSIQSLNFQTLSLIFDKLKYTKRANRNFLDNKIILQEIAKNKNILNFMENSHVDINMNFEYSNNDIKFSIIKAQKKKKSSGYIKTINEFIQNFPDLVKFQTMQGIDILELEEEKKLNEILDNYFDIIKSCIEKEKSFENLDKNDIEKICLKINSYLMSKIYDKIFPKEYDENDIKIYQECVRLSWVKPNHIINAKNFIFDNFLPDAISYISQLNDKKSPIEKCKLIIKVSEVITSTILFNNSGNSGIGVDDNLPFLQYAIIKAQPNRLSSNVKYMDLYLGKDFQSKGIGNLLAQLKLIVEKFNSISYKDFIDIKNEEEFIKLCEKAVVEGERKYSN